jgi:hypothetical protein
MSTNFLNFKKNIFSQNGEDGIIEEIFKRIGFSSKLCCEFGAWDGIHLSNTRNLVLNHDFKAFMIEGNKQRYKELLNTYRGNSNVVSINGFVDNADNSLDKILRGKGISDEVIDDMDFLSIDIDGLDYEIFEGLDIRPRVICVEVNGGHDPRNVERIPEAISKDNIGQSLGLFTQLAQHKGYDLTCFNGNAFYVLKECLEKNGLQAISPYEAYHQHLESLTNDEKSWLYLVNIGKVHPFYKFNNSLIEEKLEVGNTDVPWKQTVLRMLKKLK